MNKRIQDLAEQAGINCVVPAVGTLEYSGKGEIEHLKKFAELIVQECASIVYKTCQDGDAGAQAILYEFDIDNAKSQK